MVGLFPCSTCSNIFGGYSLSLVGIGNAASSGPTDLKTLLETIVVKGVWVVRRGLLKGCHSFARDFQILDIE